jgi:hypothetical protein
MLEGESNGESPSNCQPIYFEAFKLSGLDWVAWDDGDLVLLAADPIELDKTLDSITT